MSISVQPSYQLSEDIGLNAALDPVCQVEVDRVTPDEWSSMLDLFSDANIYQTWSYGAVRWGTKNLSHLVLKQGGEVVGMAQVRIVRPTRFNFGMAYLRWGPLCDRPESEFNVQVAGYMAHALREEYVKKRGLLLQILPNVFVGSQREALVQSAFSGFTQEPRNTANVHRTFVLSLSPSIEDLRRNLDKKWRNQLTRSEKNGLKIAVGNEAEDYRRFCRMYEQMQQRKRFESTVNVEEFARIQEDLPARHRMRILLCERDGVPVAGLVASAMGNSGIYLLGATSDDGLDAKGAYLLQWTLIQWLKESGFKWYDLGGIDPAENPGVYSFKKGLSGADVYQISPFVTCSSIFSSAIIRASVAAHRVVRSFGALRLRRALKASG
jgi:lipid II:glycine glycyltransferase (peptidoglycan interpeptide bridge formation enzyme)